MSSVAVIDCGINNLHSISKALQYVSAESEVQITADSGLIKRADRVVFPGVGAIGDCMLALNTLGLVDTIKEVASSKPFLGICLGLEVLLSASDENNKTACLAIIDGSVEHFPAAMTDQQGNRLKIPHIGWNQVQQNNHPLWHAIPQNSRFYFIHSYFAKPENQHEISATTEYAGVFASALTKNTVFAVQFHPEKSQAVGLQLLKNFLSWDGKP